MLSVAQFVEDGAKELDMLGGHDSSVEFSFGGAGGSGGLSLGTVRDSGATEEESIAGGRATIAEIVGVGGIDVASKGERGGGFGEDGESGVEDGGAVDKIRQGGIRKWPMVDKTPVQGGTKVFGDVFEETEVDVIRAGRELGKGDDGIANIGTTSDIGVEKFAKETTIGKSVFTAKGGVFGSAFIRASVGIHRGGGILGERGDLVSRNGSRGVPSM